MPSNYIHRQKPLAKKLDQSKTHFYIFRYDPNAELPIDVDTEQDRVLFIKAVAQFMVQYITCLLNVYPLPRDGLYED